MIDYLSKPALSDSERSILWDKMIDRARLFIEVAKMKDKGNFSDVLREFHKLETTLEELNIDGGRQVFKQILSAQVDKVV